MQYDYVIVGTGAGGGPLGARLASYGHRVLLIDAGDDQTNTYQYRVPALNLLATEYKPMSWNYYVDHYRDAARQARDSKMTYNTSSGGLYVGESPPPGAQPLGILYPRAGTFGGCTSHNALITVYPEEADWRRIAALTGDDSWSPSKMREYFIRLERNRYVPTSVVGHGLSGWLTTSFTSLFLVAQDWKFTAIAKSAGAAFGRGPLDGLLTGLVALKKLLFRDLNSGLPGRDFQQGLFQMPIATRDGSRSGPRDFMVEVSEARNIDGSRRYHLDIMLDTLVTRVRFDHSGSAPRAVGVDYMQGKSLYAADPRAARSAAPRATGAVDAAREVVLAAGAFNTPQLLKLSGIGPRDELAEHGIPLVVDLPGVGTNLQDRYETTLISRASEDFSLTTRCTWLKGDDPCLEDWKRTTTVDFRGTYTSNGLSLAVLKRSAQADGDVPDLFISGAPAWFTGYYPGYSTKATDESNYWVWVVLKAKTRNRAGTVKLRSADPRDMPAISFNYFDEGTNDSNEAARDVDALVEGMNFARSAVRNTKGLRLDEVWPGEARVSNDAQMRDWVKNEAWGHHASCTCPIGADGDPMAVLDSQFRVRGVRGLRVVDASVFPQIPGWFLVLPIYMISEKAADVIHESTR